MITYNYDENGHVQSVTIAGETRELTDAEQHRLPGESLPQTRTAQTAVKSTVEDLKQSYSAMTDSVGSSSIVVDIEATHGGYFNRNMYYYLTAGMRQMVTTWTDEGGCPYLKGHNMDSANDPRGRVVDARFVQTAPEMGFHALDVRVGHDEEIEMIVDGRALHVSCGSQPTDTVECSLCGHDMYHDGDTPQRYELDQEPNRELREAEAPGMFGELGLTNEDFWDLSEEDGQWTGMCRHMRKSEAPMGADSTHKVGWYLHAQDYEHIARVNEPADVNEETGEFAHIRRVKEQTDSLDPAAQAKVMIDRLSKVEDEVVDRARYQVAREEDIYRPSSAEEAASIADRAGYNVMFDSGLWTSVHNHHSGKPTGEQVQKYFDKGGRFVDVEGKDLNDRKFSDIVEEDSSTFGAWIRAQDSLDRDDERMLNRIYLNYNK